MSGLLACVCRQRRKLLAALLVLSILHAFLGEVGVVPWLQPRARLILPGHGKVFDVEWADDGRSLLTGARDVRLWNLDTGREVQRWRRLTFRPIFLPDSRTLAVFDDSDTFTPTFTLWDVATGQQRAAGEEGVFTGTWLAASPDGQTVVTHDAENGSLQLWEVTTGRRSLFCGQASQVDVANFSPDGRKLVTLGKGGVLLWDVASGKSRATLPVSWPWHRKFSPDSSTLVLDTGVLHVFDVDTGIERARLNWQSRGGLHALFSPDSRTVAALGFVEGVRLWDLATGKELAVVPFDPVKSTVVGFTPDARSLIIFSRGDREAHLAFWDAGTGSLCKTVQLGEGFGSSSLQGTMFCREWDPDSVRLNPNARIGLVCRHWPSLPTWLPDWLFLRDSWARQYPPYSEAGIWEAVSGRPLGRIRFNHEAWTLSPDGRFLAAYPGGWPGSDDGESPSPEEDTIEIWDVPPRRPLASDLAWAAVAAVPGIILSARWWSRRRCQDGSVPREQEEAGIPRRLRTTR